MSSPDHIASKRAIRASKLKGSDERCKSCSHWTQRKSEFAGWQLCDARNVWMHAADWCAQHKSKE